MWVKLLKYLEEFPSAILSGRDHTGYPYSVRCKLIPDSDNHVLQIQRLEDGLIQPGPASLLCHEHDEWIDNMRSFVVRGGLKQAGGWLFYPKEFIPGVGIGFLGGMPGIVRKTRRNCVLYLKNRDLARPRVDWNEVSKIWSGAN